MGEFLLESGGHAKQAQPWLDFLGIEVTGCTGWAARALAKKVVASRRLSIKFLREAVIIEKLEVLARPHR
jgi:hypothetical protein